MLKSKLFPLILCVGYGFLLIWMWLHSKSPELKDIPILLLLGLGFAVCLLFTSGKSTANKVLIVGSIALLIANIVYAFAAYKLVSGIFEK